MARNLSGEKLIASNPNAHYRYFIHQVLEAGITLLGTEVKSLRATSPNLKEAYGEVYTKGKKIEGWLLNAHIAPYSHGNVWNHQPLRKRKLLLHRQELQKLFGALRQSGMSLIPLRLYFKKGKVKVELGLAKGKKLHDKREVLKNKAIKKEMAQALKSMHR